jgi:hypothetical protein
MRHNSKYNSPFGEDPNYGTARKILFDGKEVRLFDCEFNKITAESMNLFIQGENGGDASHIFRSGKSLAEKAIEAEIVSGDKKEIYDAALVDGATNEQAFLVSLAKDPLALDEFPPAIGWYECKPEYLSYYF